MLPLRGLATLESSWEAEAWGPHSIGGAEPLRSFADGCRDAASLRSQPASSRTVTRRPREWWCEDGTKVRHCWRRGDVRLAGDPLLLLFLPCGLVCLGLETGRKRPGY